MTTQILQWSDVLWPMILTTKLWRRSLLQDAQEVQVYIPDFFGFFIINNKKM